MDSEAIISVGTPEFAEWCKAFAEAVANRPKPRKLPFFCGLCQQEIKAAMGYPNGCCPQGKCPELAKISLPEIDEFDTREPLNAKEFMRLVEDDQSGQQTLFD